MKFDERNMSEICRGICSNRQFLEDLLRQNSLALSPDLITYLYLLLNSLTKSSSSTILASMKSRYDDNIIKTLMNVADASAIKLLQSSKTSSCADDALVRLNEVV